MRLSVLLVALAIICSSCTRKIFIPQETIIHSVDTVEKFVSVKEKVESIDSVTTEQRGDTIYRTIVRQRHHIIAMADSSRNLKRDTVRILVKEPMEKSISEKSKRNWFQAGFFIALLLIGLLGLLYGKIKLKR